MNQVVRPPPGFQIQSGRRLNPDFSLLHSFNRHFPNLFGELGGGWGLDQLFRGFGIYRGVTALVGWGCVSLASRATQGSCTYLRRAKWLATVVIR